MKKYLTMLCSFVFCVALILTGCATVSDVYGADGKSIYFESIQYFEGQVAKIGDYIYYANGYADIDASGFDYKSSAKFGGLSRVKVSSNFEYGDVEDKQNTTPKGVESVSGKLVGYENQYMFALGSYLYFTSANTHKTSDAENDYSQVSIFRIKFNGDNLEELGTFEHDDNSIFKAVQDGENFYYLITVPADDSKTNVYSIKIGDNCGKAKKIVENAESVVLCDEESSLKKVLYTVDAENFEEETDCVKKVNLDGTENEVFYAGESGASITLHDRVGDEVFYTRSLDIKKVYIKDVSNGTSFGNGNEFWELEEGVSNVKKVDDGYLFIDGQSKSVMYNKNSNPNLFLSSDAYSDVLFVDGEYVYYSNSTSIKRMSVRTLEEETIASMTAIISGQVGYDGNYIYYFAQLENQDDDDKDENYYMYRADKVGNYTLIGKTK